MSSSLGSLESFLYSGWAGGAGGRPRAQYLAELEARLRPLVVTGVLSMDEADLWRQSYADAAADDGGRIYGLDDHARKLSALAPGAVDALGLLAGAARPGIVHHGWRAHSAPDRIDPQDFARRARLLAGTIGTTLHRVIPGPEQRVAGLRIASIETYDDWGSVVWHLVTNDPSGPHELSPFASFLRLSDDVGTEYATARSDSSLLTPLKNRHVQPNWAYHGRERFAPAPPGEATVVHVHHHAESCAITLG